MLVSSDSAVLFYTLNFWCHNTGTFACTFIRLRPFRGQPTNMFHCGFVLTTRTPPSVVRVLYNGRRYNNDNIVYNDDAATVMASSHAGIIRQWTPNVVPTYLCDIINKHIVMLLYLCWYDTLLWRDFNVICIRT